VRYSPAEVTRALSGLTGDEKRELLHLLEVRAQREAERTPDTRPSCDAHEAACKKHYEALAKKQTQTSYESIGEFLAASDAISKKAAELAAADGFPAPDWRDFARKPDPEPAAPSRRQEILPKEVSSQRGSKTPSRPAPPQPRQLRPHIEHRNLDAYTDRSGVRLPETYVDP
jgi:hypothetical protein